MKSPHIILVAALVISNCLAGTQYSIYVSSTANSGGDGSSPANPMTLSDAKSFIRYANQNQTGDIEVILAEGLYLFQTNSPLEFTEADSGRNGYRIIWRNEPGKEVRFSAGKKLQANWTLISSNDFYSSGWMPTWDFRHIYVNGIQEKLCRTNLIQNDATVVRGSADPYIEISKSNLPTWPAWHPVEIKLYVRWTTQTSRITSVEIVGNKARLRVANPHIFDDNGTYPNSQDKFSYQFLHSSFPQNGGFYQKTNSEYLYYYKPQGTNLATAEIIIPMNNKVLSVKGSTPENRARNILFYGITFEHSNFGNPSTDDGFAGFQAGRYTKANVYHIAAIPAGVELMNTEFVDFEKCKFRNMSGTALSLRENVRGSRVIGNTFNDIAGSAIALTPELPTSPGTPYQAEECFISDNQISRCGTEYQEACGIWLRYGTYNTINYNNVSDLPSTGISLGWGWGSENDTVPIVGNWCKYNHVSQVMKVLRDGAGIYTLDDHASGTSDGALVFENYIHDIATSSSYGPGHDAIGLYFDQGSKNIKAEHNKIVNISNNQPSQIIFVQIKAPAAVVDLNRNNENTDNVQAYAGPRILPASYQQERNIAPFTRVKASTSWSDVHHADKATDLRTNTCWASAAGDGGPWFRLDFQRPQHITKIEIQARQDVDNESARKNFRVYGCSGADGSGNRTLLYEQPSSPFSHQSTLSVPLPQTLPQTYRSIAVEKTDPGHFNFAEIRVFSDN